MTNAVTSTTAVSPVGSTLRAVTPESAPHAAPAPQVHAAPAPEPSVVVKISAEAAAPQVAASGHGATRTAATAAAQASAARAAAAPTPQRVQLAAAPAPLSLDPRPMEHTPVLAYQPADVNQDGHVTPAEQQNYDFHHPAASRLGAEADSTYEAIARDT